MALASTTFTGNGTIGPYPIPFPYITKDHVHVFVDAIEVSFAFLNPSLIQLSAPAPPASEGIIRRITPKDAPLVDWANGANINEENLDLQALQLLYIAQELDAVALLEAIAGVATAQLIAEQKAAAAQASASAAQASAATAQTYGSAAKTGFDDISQQLALLRNQSAWFNGH